jgi:hypothetical protein
MRNTRYLIVLFVCVPFLYGCGKRAPEGLYYDKKHWEKGRYIELKSDGSFFWKSRGQTVGKFQLEPGGITLIFEGGRAERWTINGDTLVSDGETYIHWRRGSSGFEFEKTIDELKNTVMGLGGPYKDPGTEAYQRKIDAFIKSGLVSSKEEAEEEWHRLYYLVLGYYPEGD